MTVDVLLTTAAAAIDELGLLQHDAEASQRAQEELNSLAFEAGGQIQSTCLTFAFVCCIPFTVMHHCLSCDCFVSLLLSAQCLRRR
jgi:hypothetical protein